MAILLNKEEREWFKANYDLYTVAELMVKFHCGREAVEQTARFLKIKKTKSNAWKRSEVNYLLNNFSKPIGELTRELNRSKQSVFNKKLELSKINRVDYEQLI